MFRTNELVYLGFIGAITIALGIVLGTALNATGIPMLGGLANAIVTAAVLTIGVKGVQKFGSGTILWLVVSTLAIPTLSMGPPGAHKLLVGLVAGLLWDTRSTRWALIGVSRPGLFPGPFFTSVRDSPRSGQRTGSGWLDLPRRKHRPRRPCQSPKAWRRSSSLSAISLC